MLTSFDRKTTFVLFSILFLKNRPLGRFPSIFCFNCEHFLFVCIAKKDCGFYDENFVDLKNFMEIEFCLNVDQ